MAVGITPSPLFLIHHNPNPNPNPNPTKTTSQRAFMLAKTHSSSSPIHITSSIKLQKVFEDKSTGVVCYLDDQGEMTCEGYDEGPRLDAVSRFSCYQRSEQAIVHLLKRSLLQVIDGAGKLN